MRSICPFVRGEDAHPDPIAHGDPGVAIFFLEEPAPHLTEVDGGLVIVTVLGKLNIEVMATAAHDHTVQQVAGVLLGHRFSGSFLAVRAIERLFVVVVVLVARHLIECSKGTAALSIPQPLAISLEFLL